MKVSEIIAEVRRLAETATDAGDYTDAAIVSMINRGRIEISGGGNRPYGNPKLAPLPNLFTSGTVTIASGNTGTMPTTFQRGLTRVTNSSGEKLKKYLSVGELLDRYGSETGSVEAWTIKGNTLWVAPSVTSSTVLTVYYHQFPTEFPLIGLHTGEPSELPSHLHHQLLVSFCCAEIFSESESGIGMSRPDTEKFTRRYFDALDNLDRHIGSIEAESINVNDESFTEDNIW